MSGKIVDFHSHMLPGIDDGSPDVATSLAMLQMAAQQGCQVQMLTPHYYAWKEPVRSFLERRHASCERLRAAMQPGLPQLYVGAEAAFFPHMSEKDLRPLCINGSRVLLLEMPFESWTSREIDEVATLSLDQGYRVILAHVERYLGYRGNAEKLEQLGNLPVVMQVNAETLLGLFPSKKTLALLRSGRAKLLGSDAHNLAKRKPNLGEGRRAVEKHLGAACLARIDAVGMELLQEITK